MLPGTGDESAFAELFAKLERERGFRGNLYRQKCLRRRVAVRMRARSVTRLEDYAEILDQDPTEYDRLLRVLTINVSKFFRNPETWEAIGEQVLPDVLGTRSPLVMWSAGAASGEEAYSLAILAWEWLGRNGGRRWNGIRIVGTDIDGDSLEAARAAVYADIALSETPVDVQRRWFESRDGYRLKDPIKSLVEFEQLDILKGRPDFDADVILCRNLLIYFDRPAQSQVFATFVDVLRPGGYLVLGRVETLGHEVRSHFEVVNGRERIYRKQ